MNHNVEAQGVPVPQLLPGSGSLPVRCAQTIRLIETLSSLLSHLGGAK